MAALDELVADMSAVLKKDDEVAFSYKDMIIPQEGADDEDTEPIAVDMQIEAVLEQLSKVKINERDLLTKQLFFERILSTKTVEEALPGSSELAQRDIVLKAEKAKLRSLKSARADAQKEFTVAATDLAARLKARDQARTDLENTIRRAKDSSQFERVKKVIDSGNEADMQRLIDDIDELNVEACGLLLKEMASQKEVLEMEDDAQTQKTNTLEEEALALEKEVSDLRKSTVELEGKISTNEKENAGYAAARHECAMQEQLGEMLAVLTGLRVTDVRENGMTFQLNANVFVPPQDTPTASSSPTHTLEVEFGINGLGETVVAFMHLNPPDVTVSDLREDRGLSLNTGVREVCDRLRAERAKFIDELSATP